MEPTGKPSPRREVQLQGRRPTPLRVSKDSHKIGKPPQPPIFPAPAAAPLPRQPREPVIIYTVSPKVIYADAREFMSLVQRLTGLSPTGAISPAAKLATIEKAEQTVAIAPADDIAERLGIQGLDRNPGFKGILSPVPSGLPGFSPGIFSPSVDAFLNEMSPVFRDSGGAAGNLYGGGGNLYGDGSAFITSPGNLLSTSFLPSPGAIWDFISPLGDSVRNSRSPLWS